MARPKRDWVYTNQAYHVDPLLLQPGAATGIAVPMTISQNARRQVVYGPRGVEPVWTDDLQVQHGHALPEGSRQRIYAFEMNLMVFPNDLATNSFYRLGMRLLHGEQDSESGSLLTQPNYSMWEEPGVENIAEWANAGFLREWYDFQYVATSTFGLISRQSANYRLRWTSRKGLTIANDRALYLYLETDFGSRELSLWFRGRVLMSAGAD